MRKVLVTGGAKRIGKTIVERLAADGWDVAVHYNGSAEAAETLCETVRAQGRAAVALGADLTDEDAVAGLADAAADALGGLTAVVNNASVFRRDDIDTPGREIWDLHMAVHVRAPYLLAQGLKRRLRDDSEGAVVNIVDQRVLNPSAHFLSYTLSKMALWDQTQVLARAMAPRIRVNAVGPGPVLPSSRQSEEDFALQARQTPLGHAVEASEIAAAVAFLLDAPSVSGQMIAVDAGQHMNWAFETPETAPKE
ncbi:MAG: SDR family oxidoreductase [Rhodospirillales bacterium]|nr:SDR family oxidoreductase [Rhodospirillales bacterium]MBO6785581.1 SDR family oxidoreductase [Rhodospirillales bacterium]